MTRLSRRQLLAGAAGVAASASGLADAAARAASVAKHLPRPADAPIDHVVVLMMENRSFDHFLGWLPGAEGQQAGLSYPAPDRTMHPTHPLAPDFTGCGHPDPDHSYDGARVEFDGGRCDGWLRVNDDYSIGYYTQPDLAFFGQAAPDWTVCDRYFAAILGPTFPNRLYQHAGVTDRISNTPAVSTLPTIWDRLAAAGLKGRYYYGNVPFLGLWGAKYLPISRSYAAFLDDCATGNLPQVAYVDPTFTIEGDEPGTNDDHPHADVRAGERLIAEVYRAVTTSPAWERTLLVVNFDEWGGFFEHVPPGLAPDVDPAYQQRGFRVPALLVSPLARRSVVAHDVFDHTSVLRLIEWRWGLQPLSVRDATAANLANALALHGEAEGEEPSTYAVPPAVSGGCVLPTTGTALPSPSGPGTESLEWSQLATIAEAHGFHVGR